jgi:hypothetical protein
VQHLRRDGAHCDAGGESACAGHDLAEPCASVGADAASRAGDKYASAVAQALRRVALVATRASGLSCAAAPLKQTRGEVCT